MTRLDHDHDGSTEQTPLVAGASEPSTRPRRPPHRSGLSMASIASLASIHVPKAHSGKTLIFLFSAIVFVITSTNGFTLIPLTKVVENVVCHQYYGQAQGLDTQIDEMLCKVPAVQSQMAYIFATMEVCTAITGFLAAFPWGIAADRLGRKPVFVTALGGLALSVLWTMVVLWFDTVFPPRLIATSCIFIFLGGGAPVLIGILFSMVSDVIPGEERATAFMQVHVGSLAGSLFSPSLASAMMAATGPWPVMLVGVACLVVGAIAFMFVPETLQHKGDHLSDDDDDRPEGLKAHVVHTVVQLRESISILRSTSLTLLLITSLATSPAGASLAQFLVQYISKRYEIPIQSTGYVQTAYGLAQVVQALLILPWLSHVLMQDYVPGFLRMENEQRRDLFLTRWSFGLLLLGFLALAVAPTLVIFVFGLVIMALGSASYSLAKSLMSLYVDPEHRSRLFVLVGMVETVGGMYGPPMLAGLFSLGMNLGGAWIGLPYIGISGLIATALGILLFVKVPKQRGESASPDEEARDH